MIFSKIREAIRTFRFLTEVVYTKNVCQWCFLSGESITAMSDLKQRITSQIFVRYSGAQGKTYAQKNWSKPFQFQFQKVQRSSFCICLLQVTQVGLQRQYEPVCENLGLMAYLMQCEPCVDCWSDAGGSLDWTAGLISWWSAMSVGESCICANFQNAVAASCHTTPDKRKPPSKEKLVDLWTNCFTVCSLNEGCIFGTPRRGDYSGYKKVNMWLFIAARFISECVHKRACTSGPYWS